MENKKAFAFTALVILLGSAALYQQGYFSMSQGINPMVFGDMKIKVLFEEDAPEILAYVPVGRLSSVPVVMGDPVPEADSMVLGYEEAKDMAEENNITVSQAIWGYTVDEGFLGRQTRVTGMLKRTGTLMDMMHILPKETYDSLPPGEAITVKYTEEKMPKFFYYIDKEGTNWPTALRFAQGSLDGFKPIKDDRAVVSLDFAGIDLHANQNRTYAPLVLGASEAKMMMDEGLIKGVGDRLDGFFGADAYVAGILEPTNTSLDMFHYMPKD
ncbi:MAG: hypothetical protein V1875_08490 [Candidatus Altiarchaeota archaeon]